MMSFNIIESSHSKAQHETDDRFPGSIQTGLVLQVYSCIDLSNYQPMKKGAYAELIGIGPEIIRVLPLFPL